MWSRSTHDVELFFAGGTPSRLMRTSVQTTRPGGPFVYSAPEPMFELVKYRIGQVGRAFDISLDGRRFLMVSAAGADTGGSASTTTVINWFEELRTRVPTERK